MTDVMAAPAHIGRNAVWSHAARAAFTTGIGPPIASVSASEATAQARTPVGRRVTNQPTHPPETTARDTAAATPSDSGIRRPARRSPFSRIVAGVSVSHNAPPKRPALATVSGPRAAAVASIAQAMAIPVRIARGTPFNIRVQIGTIKIA